MKRTSALIINFLLILLFTSCNNSINIKDIIDQNAPLTLTIKKIDSATGLTRTNQSVILTNSDKYVKLIHWANENTDGWHSTPASYNGEISLYQNKFRLVRINNGVVIGFADKRGNSWQYTKVISNGSLDFLSEQ